MTDYERQMVKQAAHSVIVATSTYCELLEKQMKQSDGSAEQMQEIGSSLRALNHASVTMERLCRILEGPEPGKGEENQTFSHSDKGASGVEIIIKGEPEEIAAFVLAVQKRRPKDVADEVGTEFAKSLHQEIKNRLEASRSSRESH